MFGQGGAAKIFVATRPVDFQKGIDGLAIAVQEMFGLDSFGGAVFVFRSKRADHVSKCTSFFRIRAVSWACL